MSFALAAILIGLGVIGGFAAGLLGFGGGVSVGERVHRYLGVESLRCVYAVMAALIAARGWLGILIFDD